MKVVGKVSKSDLATVYIGSDEEGRSFEFVESLNRGVPISEKWILIISTLFGCPVKCCFCDAGGDYSGKLNEAQMLFQIDYCIRQRFENRGFTCKKFKVQFSRMGEPSFNNAVLDTIEILNEIYPGFLPSLSTVAPSGTDNFFKKLVLQKKSLFKGNFQLQFSIHSTDESYRNYLIPVKKWSFQQIKEYASDFWLGEDDKKITLNFALGKDYPFDIKTITKFFSPNTFAIKITPINPTFKAKEQKLNTLFFHGNENNNLIQSLESEGYKVLLSIGDHEENLIGSNCGQYIKASKQSPQISNRPDNSYTYETIDSIN